MRIGLVDVDGHNYPNLALMKISAYHKSVGDTVSFANPLEDYDKVYKAKVFTFSDDYDYSWNCEMELGGTGYGNYSKVLPDNIEHICPDYSLYGINDTAYGFSTRGCIRHCSFCLVHDKEGKIRANAEIEEFLDGRKKLVLMDNNIVACDHGIKQLEKCRDRNIAVDCNQGIDARIVAKSDYLILLLSRLNILGGGGIRFACDDKSEIEPCIKCVERIVELNPKAKFTVFCLLTDNYDDSFNRVNQWRKYGHTVAVYAPPLSKFHRSKSNYPKVAKRYGAMGK